jgi:hypothetical protein
MKSKTLAWHFFELPSVRIVIPACLSIECPRFACRSVCQSRSSRTPPSRARVRPRCSKELLVARLLRFRNLLVEILGPTGRCPTCLVWRFTSRLGSFCKQLHDIRRNGQNGHVGGGDYPAQSRPAHTGPAPGACQLFAAESRDVLDAELDNLDLGCAELVSQVHLGPTIPG